MNNKQLIKKKLELKIKCILIEFIYYVYVILWFYVDELILLFAEAELKSMD